MQLKTLVVFTMIQSALKCADKFRFAVIVVIEKLLLKGKRAGIQLNYPSMDAKQQGERYVFTPHLTHCLLSQVNLVSHRLHD